MGDSEIETESRRRSLLCHEAVNNVLGQIRVLVDLQGQSTRLQQNRRHHHQGASLRCSLFFFKNHFHSPASLQRQRVRVAGQVTPDTWWPGICPGWDEHKAAIITANIVHAWTMYHRQTTLTNSWLGTMTVVWWVSTLTLTTSPSLVRYSSSLSGGQAERSWRSSRTFSRWAKLHQKMQYFLLNSTWESTAL